MSAVSFPRARLIISVAGAGGITACRVHVLQLSWRRRKIKSWCVKSVHSARKSCHYFLQFLYLQCWRFFIFWKGILKEGSPAWCWKCSDVWAGGSAPFRAVNSDPQWMLPDPCVMECRCSKGWEVPGKFHHGALPFLLDPCISVLCRVFMLQKRGKSDNPV